MSTSAKRVLSEFLASFLLGLFGLGMVFPMAASGLLHGLHEYGIMLGVIVAFVVIMFNPISGAQFNPAVTLAMVVSGRQDKKELVPFFLAQTAGWGLGAVLVYLIFPNQTAAYAAAGNDPLLLFVDSAPDVWSAFVLEVVMTALLLTCILAMLDDRMINKPPAFLFPWCLALLIWFMVCFAGGYSGLAINTARDLGPRVFAFIYGKIMGYDTSNLFARGVWLIYVIAPNIGAILGTLFFDKVLNNILPSKEKEEADVPPSKEAA